MTDHDLDRLRALGGACAEYADGRAESFRSLTQIRADAAIHALIAALDAEVALRDQMLHAIWLGHKKWKVPTADTEDEWLADLRARAEKEATDAT